MKIYINVTILQGEKDLELSITQTLFITEALLFNWLTDTRKNELDHSLARVSYCPAV